MSAAKKIADDFSEQNPNLVHEVILMTPPKADPNDRSTWTFTDYARWDRRELRRLLTYLATGREPEAEMDGTAQ